jgi:hypothetical protein
MQGLWRVRGCVSTKVLATAACEEGAAARALVDEHFAGLRLNIAGFGGQGALLLGQILAEMGMREGSEVSWLPSYGPEMRGGSAHCYVCLSKERVGSPLLEHPDVLIAMNESRCANLPDRLARKARFFIAAPLCPRPFL